MTRLVFVLCVALLTATACGSLSDPDDPPAEGATSTGYADFGADCTDCIDNACAQPLAACLESEACAEMAKCYPRTASPIVDAECGGELSSNLEARLRLEALRSCAKEPPCDVECRVGTHWDCLGNYPLVNPDRDTVVWRERLLSVTTRNPYVGTRVVACSRRAETDCGLDVPGAAEPVAEALTDDEGWFELELPLDSANPNEPGFDGYFRMRGGGIYPLRIQYTVPITGDTLTTTQLFSQGFVDTLLEAFVGVPLEKGTGKMTFQVFDCLGAGADRVTLSIEDPGEATKVGYVERTDFECGLGGTRANGRGNGAVLNLPPEPHRVSAAFEESGEAVSDDLVDIQAEEITHLFIFPDP